MQVIVEPIFLFLLTLLIELATFWFLVGSEKLKKHWEVVAVANLASYFIVYTLYTYLFVPFLAVEAIAVAIEVIVFLLLLKQFSFIRALALSFVLNAASVLVGFILFSLL